MTSSCSKLQCAARECKKGGVTSISAYLGIRTTSIDPTLFFCLDHIQAFSTTYSNYKALESHPKYWLLKVSEQEWARRIHLDERFIETLIEIRSIARRALGLRRKLQE